MPLIQNMKDEWLTAALSDDSVVVELLFRLKHSSSDPPKPRSLYLPLGWGHRQPRSKPLPISAKKDSTATTSTTRYSPTTPLSWSDGAYEDYSNSSHRSSSDPSRSKGPFANDTANATSNSKRSRKKKELVDCAQTFTELKKEENLLLKERVNLTRELASLHVTLEEQRAWCENLKRIKVDLNLQSTSELGGTSGDPVVVVSNHSNQIETLTSGPANLALPRHATYEGLGSSSSCRGDMEVETQQRCFFLPDLNVMPAEEDIGPEILSGIS